MENKINFGLDLEKNIADSKRETNYQFGAVENEILMADGDWTGLQPECEIQKSDYCDYMDCVTEASINALSMIMQRKFNIKVNWSQRYIAKLSGTTRSGNSLYAVANAIRKYGLVAEIDWPRDRSMDWNEYYATVSDYARKKGDKYVVEFEVNYYTVPTTIEALDKSQETAPPVVIGYSWASENGIYKDYGYRPNHAFVRAKKSAPKTGLQTALDSYPTDFMIDDNSTKQEFFKTLASDFKFGDALIYTIKLKPTDRRSWLYKIMAYLKNLKMNFYKDRNGNLSDPANRANGEVYITKDGKKKKVDDVNDLIAVLEMNFGIEKTDWGELGKLQTTEKL